ncbi:MAG: hypothetical protein GY845_30340 [Planctomycetes bacterium]|nr:hypothetical protein [Planctomycetota bacterium]
MNRSVNMMGNLAALKDRRDQRQANNKYREDNLALNKAQNTRSQEAHDQSQGALQAEAARNRLSFVANLCHMATDEPSYQRVKQIFRQANPNAKPDAMPENYDPEYVKSMTEAVDKGFLQLEKATGKKIKHYTLKDKKTGQTIVSAQLADESFVVPENMELVDAPMSMNEKVKLHERKEKISAVSHRLKKNFESQIKDATNKDQTLSQKNKLRLDLNNSLHKYTHDKKGEKPLSDVDRQTLTQLARDNGLEFQVIAEMVPGTEPWLSRNTADKPGKYAFTEKIDKETAIIYYQKANGDIKKAEELAAKDGYTF